MTAFITVARSILDPFTWMFILKTKIGQCSIAKVNASSHTFADNYEIFLKTNSNISSTNENLLAIYSPFKQFTIKASFQPLFVSFQ